MTDPALWAVNGAALLLLAYAALSDLRGRRIPNRASVILALAFLPAALLAGLPWPAILVQHLGAGLLVFAVGIPLFALGWLGGGDVKLLAATGLWFGWQGLFPLLLMTALAGGGLALLMLLLGRYLPQRPGRDKLPYAIAIALGALLAARHLETLP